MKSNNEFDLEVGTVYKRKAWEIISNAEQPYFLNNLLYYN